MDHEAYENEMIDTVNRHAEEKTQHTGKKSLFTKSDVRTLKRGLKRTVLALLTGILFGLAVYDFIAVATATGYWAVFLFLSAILLMLGVVTLLYAQGITYVKSDGDSK